MCRGHAFIDIHAEIDGGGLPLPRAIALPDGRIIAAAMMSVAPITTARGVESYRYELWAAGAAHIVYLQNSLPLRWYVEVELPFGEGTPDVPALNAVAG